MQSVASVFAIELRVVNVRDKHAIESGITRIAEFPKAGLLITASAPANVHRDLILRLADHHRLPAVYPYRYFVAAGGLACYGPDTIGQYRRAAGYVDRILKREKPADLPVQAPTKYELVINLKTANSNRRADRHPNPSMHRRVGAAAQWQSSLEPVEIEFRNGAFYAQQSCLVPPPKGERRIL
jgi:hypothetical protein